MERGLLQPKHVHRHGCPQIRNRYEKSGLRSWSRFETKWLSRPEILAALADLLGQWIDKVHRAAAEDHRTRHYSSESPT
jgi:hypothetical protein